MKAAAVLAAAIVAGELGGTACPASACSLVVLGNGILKLSTNGTRLASDESGGNGATLTVANTDLSAATVTVEAPTISSSPSGFNISQATTRIKYIGSGLLSGVTRAYTAARTTFSVPALLGAATLVTFDNEITTTSGFAAGTYNTRITVTCS